MRRVICCGLKVCRARGRGAWRASLGSQEWTPVWRAPKARGDVAWKWKLGNCGKLMSEQAGLICAARHARKTKLNVIIFPAANRTNVIAAGGLAED